MLNPFNTAKQTASTLTSIGLTITSGPRHSVCSLIRAAGASALAVRHLPSDVRDLVEAAQALVDGLDSGEVEAWWD